MKNKLKRTFAVMLVLAATLGVLFTLVSCDEVYGGTSEILSQEELAVTVAESSSDGREYVAEYLDAWRFPKFLISKMELLERLYRDNFVDECGDVHTRAVKTANVFLEAYYAKTELSDHEAVTDALINSYVETYDDPYSLYRTKAEYEGYYDEMSGSFVGIGVTVSYDKTTDIITVVSLTEGGGAEAAGILVGDIIVSVDGKRADVYGYQATVDAIKGEAGTETLIGVVRDGEEKSFTVTRKIVVNKTVTYDIRGNIAYIKITSFKRNTYQQFREAIDRAEADGARGIIYDLRGNYGGYLDTVVDMLGYIAPKGTEIVSFTNDYDKPAYAKNEHTLSLPSVVICDGDSASAAELFTAGIRDFAEMGLFRASIVGERTFGKGIMQDTFKFSDGSSITMTVAYYNPPLGENYHGVGIEPNLSFDFPDANGEWRTAAEKELLRLMAE